nr:MAG TPA: hypothetical protein [Caudoviricetes sp.]
MPDAPRRAATAILGDARAIMPTSRGADVRRGGWRAATTAEGQPPGRACWRPRPPGSVLGRARSRRALTSLSVPLRPRDGAGGAINAASDNYTGQRRAWP